MGKIKFVDENSAVVALVENRDKDAFEYLYLKYKGTIERLVTKYIYNPDDRLEIEQSIWAQVYAKAHTFQRKSLFISWVYRIAVNFCLNFLNSVSRNPLYKQSQLSYMTDDGEANLDFVDYLKVDDTTPLDLLENSLDIELFNRTFAELSDDIQSAFEMLQNGMTNQEIADHTDSLCVTVRSRSLRVRQAFRNALLLKDLEAQGSIAMFIDTLLTIESEKVADQENTLGRGIAYMKILPDDKLEVFVMARDGKGYDEIAEWLGVSEREVADTLIEIKNNLCKLIKLV